MNKEEIEKEWSHEVDNEMPMVFIAECGYCHGEGIKHDPVCKRGKDIIIVLLKEKI